MPDFMAAKPPAKNLESRKDICQVVCSSNVAKEEML